MFPVIVMEVILWHSGFWTVEDRGFVHVVPEKSVGCGTWEGGIRKQGLPPGDGGGVEAVDPVGGTGPAPAFVDIVVFVFNSEGFGF